MYTKFGEFERVVFEICVWEIGGGGYASELTDRHTHRLMTILRTPTGGSKYNGFVKLLRLTFIFIRGLRQFFIYGSNELFRRGCRFKKLLQDFSALCSAIPHATTVT